MDFEKMARSASALLYDETGSPMPQIVETRLAEAFAAAFAAGREAMRETCAELANDEAAGLRQARSNASAFNDRREAERLDAAASTAEHIAAAIRALPGKEGE